MSILNVTVHGINVEQVTLVINCNLPYDAVHRPDFETYLHRALVTRGNLANLHELALSLVDE